MGVKYNPKHQWKYVRGMTPDEFVLIKWFGFWYISLCLRVLTHFSSTILIRPRTVTLPFSLHILPSRILPRREMRQPRESIELRALVFYD